MFSDTMLSEMEVGYEYDADVQTHEQDAGVVARV
jgi:hypothetical protein